MFFATRSIKYTPTVTKRGLLHLILCLLHKICQEHWVPESSEHYWQKVIDNCQLFNETFKDIGFAKFLAVALIDYLEAKNK